MGAAASAQPAAPAAVCRVGNSLRKQYDAFLESIRRSELAIITKVCGRYPAFLGLPPKCGRYGASAWHVASSLPSSGPLELLFSVSEYMRATAADKLAAKPVGGRHVGAGAHEHVQAHLPSPSIVMLIQDARGLTPLMTAALKGSTECVQLLLEKGADPWLADPDGFTALHWAATSGHARVVELLLEAPSCRNMPRAGRAFADAPCKFGLTALHLAAARGQTDAVAVLLRHCASLNARGHTKDASKLEPFNIPAGAGAFATPLHVAAARGSVSVVKLMLSYFLENALVRAKSPMHDPRLQRNGSGQRPVDVVHASRAAAAHVASGGAHGGSDSGSGGSNTHSFIHGHITIHSSDAGSSRLSTQSGPTGLPPRPSQSGSSSSGSLRAPSQSGSGSSGSVRAASQSGSGSAGTSSRAASQSGGASGSGSSNHIVSPGGSWSCRSINVSFSPGPAASRSASASTSRVPSQRGGGCGLNRSTTGASGGGSRSSNLSDTAADTQLRQLLDPSSCLTSLLPEVAKCAVAIHGHRRIDGVVPTLQMLAAAALSKRLTASAAAAKAAAACGAKSAGGAAAAAIPARVGRAESVASTSSRRGSSRSLHSCASAGAISCNLLEETSSGSSSASSSTSPASSPSSSGPSVSYGGDGGAAGTPGAPCGICMTEPATLRSSTCSHAMCGACVQQLCRMVPGKLMPLQCPFCRTVVESFEPAGVGIPS